jgi:hypothetical protein
VSRKKSALNLLAGGGRHKSNAPEDSRPGIGFKDMFQHWLGFKLHVGLSPLLDCRSFCFDVLPLAALSGMTPAGWLYMSTSWSNRALRVRCHWKLLQNYRKSVKSQEKGTH